MRRSNDSVSSFNTRIIVSFSIFWFQFKLTRWVFALLTTRWTERIHFECWKINNDRVFRQWFHCSIISSFIQDSGLCLNLSPVNGKWKKVAILLRNNEKSRPRSPCSFFFTYAGSISFPLSYVSLVADPESRKSGIFTIWRMKIKKNK